MPNKTLLDGLFGDNYKDFGVIGDGLQVVYALASQKFPIGYIGDKNTPAELGRTVVEQALGEGFGLIHNLMLNHTGHNIVDVQPDVASVKSLYNNPGSISLICDGLIIPRTGDPFVVQTFLGDCACVVAWSDEWVGYMHVGRPEVMAEPSVIENFFKKFPSKPQDTRVWIGPCIAGPHYELLEIPEKFRLFKDKTIWGTQGFEIEFAIGNQIVKYGLIGGCNFSSANICPYKANEDGNHTWAASDQWYRRKGRELGIPLFSPRNSAMLFVTG